MSEVDLSVDDPHLPWRERVIHAAGELRRVLVSHRGISMVFGARASFGPNLLAGFERFVSIFADAGFQGRALALANQTVLNYATGFAVFESRGVSGPITEGRTLEEVQALMSSMLRALPPDRFPTLVSIADDMAALSNDDSFEYGLGRLLDGLEMELARTRSAGDTAVEPGPGPAGERGASGTLPTRAVGL
jgi:hypothetical protein